MDQIEELALVKGNIAGGSDRERGNCAECLSGERGQVLFSHLPSIPPSKSSVTLIIIIIHFIY